MRIAAPEHRALLAVALLTAALLSACASTSGLRSSRLELAVHSFEKAMRWSDFASAASHLDPKAPLPDLTAYQRIKIVSYETRSLELLNDTTEARLVSDIRYVHTDRMRERQFLSSQHWRYDEQESRWRLVNGLPAFP
jgi:hypothetical protein